MAKYYRTEIQKKISALLTAGPFLQVTYDPTTRVPSVGAVAVAPSAIVVNEVSSSFDDATNHGRTHALDRVTWVFSAMVAFDVEVLLEGFEHAITTRTPLIEREIAEGITRQVEIRLVAAAAYEHPTEQGSTSGTQVVYTFEARLTRL